MKKVLIGLFLVASLSVLGAKNTKKAARTQNYTKNVNNQYSVVDGNLMNMYSKEKTEFKNKYIALSEKNDKKNLIALLKKYVEKYPFIELFSKENGGVSDARNYGIEQTKYSDYIAFIDPDDSI